MCEKVKLQSTFDFIMPQYKHVLTFKNPWSNRDLT